MSYGRYPYAAGGIGDFFKSAGKFIGGAVGAGAGFLVGGPAGAIAGAKIGSKVGGIAKGAGALVPAASLASQGPGFSLGPIRIDPLAVLPGGAPFISSSSQGPGIQCPVGFHPNKQASAKGPARSYCVRNRSMNPANGRAIGRAATRIKKGAKQYARVLRVLGKKTGRMVPRGRKRS